MLCGRGDGGGGTMIFSYIRKSVGFSKLLMKGGVESGNEFLGGYEEIVAIFSGSLQNYYF